MEGDCKKSNENDQEKLRNCVPNDGNVFQSIWVRCPFCSNNEMDKFILDYGRYFLLPVGIFLWSLFLILQKN